MESRWQAVWAAGGVLVASTVLRLSPPAASPPVAPAPQQTAAATSQTPPRPPVTARVVTGTALLGEFLGDTAGPDTARGDTAAAGWLAALDRLAAEGPFRYRLDVLIATVPDPVDSHLDWAYDSYVEAVRRAYERAGFVTDRFWVPWGTLADTARVGGLPVREAWPGVMLFRKVDPDTVRADSVVRLGLLYLVGEVPTRGVHRPALLRALRERDALLAASRAWAQGDSARRHVRIVGPAFSGTSFSLRAALEAWIPDSLTAVDVVTGSATNLENRALLQDTPRIRFGATVHPDEALMEALYTQVLRPMRIPRGQVAILREGSTYGRNVAASGRQPGAAGRRRCGAGLGGPAQDPDTTDFLVVPFPMNISRLRSEYARRPAVQPQSLPAGVPAQAPPQPAIPVDLSDRARPLESPPVQSELTLPMLEAALTEIGHTLARHDVRVVGVLASDVRDKLFLAREVRRRVTDAQVFTLEGNSLFLAPEHNRALRGMLVVSTYPLFLQDQWWQLPLAERHRLPFTNEGAQGVHNAVLMQLGRPDLLAEYTGEPGPDGAQLPRVWITAVGSRSFLPLATAPPAPCDYVRTAAAAPPAGSAGTRARPEFFTLGAVGLLGLLLAGFSAAALADARTSLRTRGPKERGVAATVRCESLRMHGHLYRALRIVAVGAVFGPPALLVQRGLELTGAREAVAATLATRLLLAFAAVALVLQVAALLRILRSAGDAGLKYALRPHWRTRGRQLVWLVEIGGRGLVAALGVVFLVLSVAFYVQVARIPHEEFALYLHRVAQLDGGVSPILPLLVGGFGFAVWCTWHLARIHRLRELTAFEAACLSRVDRVVDEAVKTRVRPAGDDDDEDDAPWRSKGLSTLGGRTVRAVCEVRSRLFLLVPNVRGLLLMIVMMVLAWILARHVRPPLEMVAGTTAFDGLLRLLVVGSLVATAWAVYRLLAVWRALQRCLVELGTTPLATAFERLPAHVSQLTRLTLVGAPSCQILAAVSASQRRHLERLMENATCEMESMYVQDWQRQLPLAVHAFDAEQGRFQAGRWDCHQVEEAAGSYRVLNDVLGVFWTREPEKPQIAAIAADVKGSSLAGGGAVPDTAVMIRRSYPDALRLWLRAAEEFAAVQVVDYVEWVLQQMRTLAMFLFVCLLLTTSLLSCYPYEPQSVVKGVFALILLGTVGALLYVMTDMNRNEVLSRIAKTDPGRVTWDRSFIVNAVLLGIVPLLALVSSEVPQLRTVLFFWITPLLRTLVGG